MATSNTTQGILPLVQLEPPATAGGKQTVVYSDPSFFSGIGAALSVPITFDPAAVVSAPVAAAASWMSAIGGATLAYFFHDKIVAMVG